MNALLLPGAFLLAAGALVSLVAYLFRREQTIEATTRLVKIGGALTIAGSATMLLFVFGDAITTMPELRK